MSIAFFFNFNNIIFSYAYLLQITAFILLLNKNTEIIPYKYKYGLQKLKIF